MITDNEKGKWRVLSSQYLIRKPWLTARVDKLEMPDGRIMPEYYVLEYPDWVNVIAITKDGKFVMERQYRHAAGITAYELPCGVIEKGESPLEAAKRELAEETGYGGGEWRELMQISPNPGAMTNMTHCFVAAGVEKVSEQHFDEHECLTVHLLDRDEVFRHMNDGSMVQSLMLAPLWRYFCECAARETAFEGQMNINRTRKENKMSITIKPVRFTENGFMTEPFALGGEGAEGLDPAVKYRSCLQNWVIDTGSEVILVDTGLPAEFPDAAPTADAAIYLGSKIKTYLEALADLGYKPEQVSKILITHKHADHTGELRAFPNAQIICSAAEAETDEIKPFKPTIATFQDGPYYEFPMSQRIAEGVTYLFAPGHTSGNCIVAVETDGLFYLIHGDVTYTDVAFYRNKLSVVYDDKAAARETLDRCRAFCAARPTVWLGTHTPEALESLEQHRVVDLANPPAVIPPGEIVFKTPTGKYICSVCGYVYDPAEHDGVAFEDLPADWRCLRCKQPKEKFNRA